MTGKNNSKNKGKQLPKGFQQFGAMTIGMVSPKQMVRRRQNYRAMDAEGMATLKASLGEIGFQGLILATKGKERDTYEILDGHHRWQAATEMNLGEIPVVLIDGNADKKDLAMLSFNVTADILPDVYVDFLAEMNLRVGPEMLAKFTAVDQDFLAELTAVAAPGNDLLESLGPTGTDKTSDHSRGRAITVILPRSDEAVALLQWAVSHYEASGEGEAVLSALRDCHEHLGSSAPLTIETHEDALDLEAATDDSEQPEPTAEKE